MADRDAISPAPRLSLDVAAAARLVFLGFPAVATVLMAVGGGVQNGDWYPWAFVTTLVAGALLLFDVVRPRGGAGAAAAAAITALAALSMLSTAWAVLPGEAFVEGARALLYAATFVVVLSVVRTASDARALVMLIGAACGGIELLAAVRLATGPPGSWFVYDRLAWPTGYPNTAASVGVLAFWTLAGLGVRRELWPPVRALALGVAGAALGVALLAESRGAVYSFVLVTPIVLIVLRERLRLAVAALLAAAPVAAAWPSINPALTTGASSSVQHAARVLLVTSAVGALVAGAVALADRRLSLGALERRRIGHAALAASVVLALVGVGLGLAHHAPDRARTAWRTFSGQQTDTGSGDRLLTFGSNRYDFWRVALNDLRARPLQGYGAGGFGPTYLEHGRSDEAPAQAHGQVFELVATLGLPGLLFALVPAAIGLAGLAGWPGRTRARPSHDTVLAGAFAGVLCVLVHAQADWHWQSAAVAVPVVSLLAAGAALLDGDAVWPARLARAAGAALVVAALVWVLPGLLSVRLQDRAASHGDLGAAHLAGRLDPFAADPLLTAANLENDRGAHSVALRHAREATRREPGNWVTWATLARLTSRPAERQVACRRAHHENPRLRGCSTH